MNSTPSGKTCSPASAALTKSPRSTPRRSTRKIAGEVKNFDPAPAFPSPKEVRRTDRFSQFGVYAGWQALLDSGLDLDKVNRDEIGVFIGSGIGGLEPPTSNTKFCSNAGRAGSRRS